MGLIDRIRAGTYVPENDDLGPAPGSIATLATTAQRIVEGEDALFAVREFLDQLPRLTAEDVRAAIVGRPTRTGDLRVDALLAGLAEHLAAAQDSETPRWALEPERFLDRYWFVSTVPGFRATALAQTPVALKRRGIFWPARSLTRV